MNILLTFMLQKKFHRYAQIEFTNQNHQFILILDGFV
jgi:hypothetical protein